MNVMRKAVVWILTALSSVAITFAAPADELKALFDEEWQARANYNPFGPEVEESPVLLPAVSPEDYQRQMEAAETYWDKLKRIDKADLSKADQLNYDIFEFILRHRIESGKYKLWRIPFQSDNGFYSNISRALVNAPKRNADDIELYIARIEALPDYFEQHIENMRQGISDGFTMPREIMDGIFTIIEAQVISTPEESPLWAPFEDLPAALSDRKKRRLRDRGRRAIEASAMPAFENVRDFFRDEYIPASRKTLGAADLPNGDALYETRAAYFTTIDGVTADDIHETGLHEVARIKAEMLAIIEEVEFDGTLKEFIEFLRTDPQFYVEDPEQYLKEAAYIAKSVDGVLPKYFGKMPRMPYGVQPVPDDLAPNYTTGRYVSPPADGSYGGRYWVNVYNIGERPLYTLAALTVHEAAPGHHMQNALAKEIENAPKFRQYMYLSGFGEGWGLYTEKLGVEMGIYKTPYEHFGRLSYEMLRGVRLVVDTGIHVKGWTRKQAFDYLADNSAISLQFVRTEIDRYIAWPGQATAYKMGELKLWELRSKAEAELGDKFDIRSFHDAVLVEGAMPLAVLERRIDDYIAEQKEGSTK